ncbi:hypothetical protein BG58_04910 [Caballeronia jiangsuensis]|nr:hypothetical protein BG58_04910 [Caballeronia jiangsuensis]
MILHPFQEQRVCVKDGQYAGATGRVVRVLDGYGADGFVELAFDKRKDTPTPKSDLVPVAYLDFIDGSGAKQPPKKERDASSAAVDGSSLF